MKTNMNIRKIFRNSVRLYFAPLTGAFRAVRSELHRIEKQHQREAHQNKLHA